MSRDSNYRLLELNDTAGATANPKWRFGTARNSLSGDSMGSTWSGIKSEDSALECTLRLWKIRGPRKRSCHPASSASAHSGYLEALSSCQNLTWTKELFEPIPSSSRLPQNPVAVVLREASNRRADGAHPSGIGRGECDDRPIRAEHRPLRPDGLQCSFDIRQQLFGCPV
jgi:hypothetical protein